MRQWRLSASRALGALVVIAVSEPSIGHDIALRVGRTDDALPRLVVLGVPPKPVTGRPLCLPLYPGDGIFEGVWLHDQPAVRTLRADDPETGTCRVAPGSLVAVRRIAASPGVCFAEPSSMRPILARDGDCYAFICDDAGDFSINLLAVAEREGPASATLQFVDLAGLQAEAPPLTLCFQTAPGPDVPIYICPMRCEGERTYAERRRCPVCGMMLADTRAHADHTPKHGGIFFMAPDNTHHLEGALGPSGDFRVWFYDEFTRPISAAQFASRTEMRRADAERTLPVKLSPEPGDAFSTARIPAEIGWPLSVKLFVDFKDGAGEQVFDFDFEFDKPAPRQ